MTDRRSIGGERFARLLASLHGALELSVLLREKDDSDRETMALASQAQAALGPGVPLFVHRRFDLALATGAQGVHLPSDGLPPGRVRANTPRGFRIGVSTHSVAQAVEAIAQGADLVVFGPIFATPSKAGFGEPLSPEALSGLPPAAEHGRDVLAIGGVSEANLPELAPWRDRITGVAGIRLFQEADDPAAVVRRIAEQ